MAESPTVPSNIQSDAHALKLLLQFLSAGIGGDRPKEYLGAEKVTVGVASTAFTIPAGTTIVKLTIGTEDDVHIRINAAAVVATSVKYFKGQEYWLGGGALTNLTTLFGIRPAGADVTVWAEYFKQD